MNIFDTAVLAQVVAYLPAAQSWLLDRYLHRKQRSETEEIYFDVGVAPSGWRFLAGPAAGAGQDRHLQGL